MFTKLVTSLGNDVIVLNIEGCASIVGFRDYISKTFKVTKLDSVDEEKEDELVRKRLRALATKVMILVILPMTKQSNTLVPHCYDSFPN